MKRGAFATLAGIAVALSCGGSDENVARIRHGDAATAGSDASAGTSGAGSDGTTDAAGRAETEAGGAGTGGIASDASDAEASIDAADDGCHRDCIQVPCTGHIYFCGDCQDNDGDGLIDSEDPECLSPCDSTEDTLGELVPACDKAPCGQDCYFDYDCGSGNDLCYWNHQCDPLEVPPSLDPEGSVCSYAPSTTFPNGLTCSDLATTQPAQCTSYCGPLVPNGCDCFGCCELPAGSGRYVWLGSPDGLDIFTCELDVATDDSKCHPCTPVKSCFNPCETCELCLGKYELPAECGGVPSCPAGAQTCMGPCPAPCPVGSYCLNGCCTPAPL